MTFSGNTVSTDYDYYVTNLGSSIVRVLDMFLIFFKFGYESAPFFLLIFIVARSKQLYILLACSIVSLYYF